ncbi:unnamed protein product [Cylicocyclus nassatus]|uniref:Nose resistant-to-fluoxetine protein N-terminal domain-containing protein n=1 Tax=Cylicocyclus nassatus TaxID=53992 RepID=A0AA36LZA8_CYLNA|nr:unnamed protein product [Cylicocyclus nassatus]
MRLHIIVLSLITAPINCNYPQFNANSDRNSTSTQAYKGEGARNVTLRLADRRAGRWRHYNKLVKKLIKFVENLQQADGQQCITDLTTLLAGASSVLAQAPFCALVSQNCGSDLPYWKLRVLDAWPRLPPGLTSKGPMFLLGDYDTCAKQWDEVIEEMENITSERVHYCRTTMTAKSEAGAITVTTGFCLPSSCRVNAVASLASHFSEEFLGFPGISENWISVDRTACQGKNDNRLVEKLLLISSIAITLILITGTSLDVFVINKRPGKGHADDRTFSGSDMTAAMNAPRKFNWFNAPSVALTYKNVPDLSRTLAKPAIILDILCSFSVRVSLRQLNRNTAKEIACLNGIKVISMLWVILGHSSLFTLPYMDNLPTFLPLLKRSRWLAPILLNSSLAVDSFLFISGTVVAFSMRKRLLFR